MNPRRNQQRRRSGRLSFALILALLMGCNGVRDDDSLTILVSGDTAGWITPCGCAANQSGGLARRATLVASRGAPEQTLYLDAGGTASGTTEYQQIKLEAILLGLNDMNLSAHNIGGPESDYDPEQLGEIADRTGVTWLSANLGPAQGDMDMDDVVIVERHGARFAVTGIVEPELVKNPAWKTREPIAAVLDALRDIEADVRVVLAYCDERGLRSLAESLPEVDFIIGGPTGQAMKPSTVGPVTIMSATNKGKFLAQIKVARGADERIRATHAGPAEVKSNLAEHPAQLANLKRYYDVLAQREFSAAEAGLVTDLHPGDDDYQIAGSETCMNCHKEDHALWQASRHSHAWDVLVQKNAHVDPYCQQCHTTGYGYEGGFVSVSRSPHTMHVGCENCHGPSSAHVGNPKVKTPFDANEQCIRCHDHENSPEFVFDVYWPKILHGKQTVEITRTASDSP